MKLGIINPMNLFFKDIWLFFLKIILGMIKKIPTLIIAKIKKYNERPFYDLKNQNDDDYEDFKL